MSAAGAGDLFGEGSKGPGAGPFGVEPGGRRDRRNSAESDDLPGVLDPEGHGVEGSARRVPEVRGRAGERGPFDVDRLIASLERARSEARRRAGHGFGSGVAAESRDVALEVADIVRFTLVSRLSSEAASAGSASTIEVDELGELVERALVEVGAVDLARAYIVARDRRLRSLAATGTGQPREGGGSAGVRLPMVTTGLGTVPFQARRIVAALIEEAGLLPESAQDVASRVERRLVDAGIRVASSGLVRELVNSELLTLDHGDALRRHEAVGVPRHDLMRLFDTARPEPPPRPAAPPPDVHGRRFEAMASRELLSRWELADVLSTEVAQAHRAGEIEVVGLGGLHRVLVRAVPAGLLARGARGSRGSAGRSSALELCGAVARLARDTHRGVVVEGIGELAGHGAGGPERLADLLAGLGAVSWAAHRMVDLARPEASRSLGGECSPGARTAALLVATDRAREGGSPCPRLWLTWDEVERACLRPSGSQPMEGAGPVTDPGDTELVVDHSAAAASERLLAAAHLIPVWSSGDEGWAAPACRRTSGDRGVLACAGAVALNLPRMARRAGPWREDLFLAELERSLALAHTALCDVLAHQARARRVQGEAVADELSTAVTPVGLFEALRILGDGLARAEQGARILGFLHDATSRLAAPGGARLRLAVGLGDGAGQRFAALDARARGPEQPRLFGDLPRPEDERPASYRTGWGDLVASGDESRVERRAEGLGALLGTTRAGALVPEPGGVDLELGVGGSLRSGEETLDRGAADAAFVARRPRLAAWRRFAAMRERAPEPDRRGAGTTLF